MKKNIIFWTLACLLVASCAKDAPQDTAIKARTYNYFSTEVSGLDMTATGGNVTVTVTSNVEWKLSGDEKLKIEPASGFGDAEITVTVPENKTFDARTFLFDVFTDTELDVEGDPSKFLDGKKETYTVNQAAIEKVFTVDQTSFSVLSSDTHAVFNVIENVGYSIECGEGVQYSVAETDKGHAVTLTFPANSTSEIKTYTATVKAGMAGVTPSEYVITVEQAAFEPIFEVDQDAVSVKWSATSAVVTLTENIGYNVNCVTSGLTYQATDVSATEHTLTFSFPANSTENKVTYTATISPQTAYPSVTDITITITQAAHKLIVIDCTDASKFRYNKNGSPGALPSRNSNVECDFWQYGFESYIFHGKVANWSKSLNAAKNELIKLPLIAGYKLSEVFIAGVYNSGDKTFNVTDGTKTLGTAVVNKAGSPSPVSATITLTDTYSATKNYYLTSTTEMGVMFKLTYECVE